MSKSCVPISSPLLSIIIPVYNTGQYLKRCLDSVLTQTYSAIEVIIVNDASPDNSHALINEYKQKDARVSCITHTENRGLFHARLSSVQASRGAFIAHLDSDDYVSIDFYRSLIAALQKTKACIAIGDIVNVNENGRKSIFNLLHSEVQFDTLEGKDILDRYFRQHCQNFYWHAIWNKVCTKDLWDKAFPHFIKQEKHLVFAEDVVFSTLLFFYAKKITRVPDTHIFWCQREGSASSVKGLSYKKLEKNIEDIATSYSFISHFMKEKIVIKNKRIIFCYVSIDISKPTKK